MPCWRPPASLVASMSHEPVGGRSAVETPSEPDGGNLSGNPESQELVRLNERVRRLAADKAYLQLVNQLMTRLSTLPGLENLIQGLLQSVSDTIGGTNVVLYYWINGRLHQADVYGNRRQLESIDDPAVEQVAMSLQPLQVARESESAKMMSAALVQSWTWIYPLAVGDEMIGVLRIENLHISSRQMQAYLPNFFTFAAALLKNDILGFSQLKQAYDELKTTNVSLAAAREAAEAASRAKNTFLANMSHELRTPLNAILGFSQILAREPELGKVQRSNLQAIQHSGQHLLELINDILELSRIEAGQLSLRNESFSLTELVDSAVEMVQGRASAKGLKLVLSCSPNLPIQVQGDCHHLRQVLINLLTNAIKYTSTGGVTFTVGWNGKLASFEVEDTGAGISEDEQEKVFTSFYQTDFATSQGEGSGLGLAISRDHVRLMGGEIKLKSQLGVGSRFSFEIPLVALENKAVIDETPRGNIIGLSGGQPTWRVLIADDDADSRTWLSQLLEDIGFQVRTVTNGEEALSLCHSWRPHFIWMDVHMPVMGGLPACSRIRAIPGCESVRIVAMTATALEDSRPEVLAAGCDDFLCKPATVAEMLEMMRKHLGVQFRYAITEESPATLSEAVYREPEPQDLLCFPEVLREELLLAANTLDADAARRVLDTMAETDADTVQPLRDWVDKYRFDRIIRLINALGSEPVSTR